MTIIKAILEIENESEVVELQEADILLQEYSEQDIEKMKDSELADLISDELGFCVSEIIGYKEPDYIIN